MPSVKEFLLAAAATALIASASAAPYVPEGDEQILERLPKQSLPERRELVRMRAELAASPRNVPLATALARRYIEAGRSTGDPRYLGYAQAALAPWWEDSDPPAQVRVLRATILQSQHQFDQAMKDLDAALQVDPRNAQAWLTRATVLQVQGEYEKSRQSCLQLQGLAPELVFATCMANAISLSGQADRAYEMLDSALHRHEGADPGLRAWAGTLLGEIAVRLGHYAAAEANFRRALSLDASDPYLRGALADLLLDQGRNKDAAALLEGHDRVDGLLLRRAIALQRLGAAAAQQSIDTLSARFAAAQRRGDTLHERERARFELYLRNDPEAALEFALKNWERQKEPADARVLLEAALASNAGARSVPVLEWLSKTGVQDQTLLALASKLERPR
jgi:Tfp pilus assembly protein PilF